MDATETDHPLGEHSLQALADLHEITAVRRWRRLQQLAPVLHEARTAFEAAERLTAALGRLR